jgi:hypothetical protein
MGTAHVWLDRRPNFGAQAVDGRLWSFCGGDQDVNDGRWDHYFCQLRCRATASTRRAIGADVVAPICRAADLGLAAGPGLLPGLLELLSGSTGPSPYRQVGQPCQRRCARDRVRLIYRSCRRSSVLGSQERDPIGSASLLGHIPGRRRGCCRVLALPAGQVPPALADHVALARDKLR